MPLSASISAPASIQNSPVSWSLVTVAVRPAALDAFSVRVAFQNEVKKNRSCAKGARESRVSDNWESIRPRPRPRGTVSPINKKLNCTPYFRALGLLNVKTRMFSGFV